MLKTEGHPLNKDTRCFRSTPCFDRALSTSPKTKFLIAPTTRINSPRTTLSFDEYSISFEFFLRSKRKNIYFVYLSIISLEKVRKQKKRRKAYYVYSGRCRANRSTIFLIDSRIRLLIPEHIYRGLRSVFLGFKNIPLSSASKPHYFALYSSSIN